MDFQANKFVCGGIANVQPALRCTQDLFSSDMVRHTNPEMTMIKEEGFILKPLETRGGTLAQGSTQKHLVGQEAEAARGRRGCARPLFLDKPFLCFLFLQVFECKMKVQ